jgi:hypothetical protein
MEKEKIDKMVDNFLSWQLPQDFCPDGRISFNSAPDAIGQHPQWPVGTNLFTAVQARTMIEHMLSGIDI